MNTKKSLQAIVSDSLALDEILYERSGEITDQETSAIVDQFMSEILSDLAHKSDSYKFKIDQLDDAVQRMNTNAKQFSQVAKSISNIANSMQNRMKNAIIDLGVTEIIGNTFKFKLAKTAGSVVIENENLLPATYCREKTSIEIDKVAIKEDLKIGKLVPGAKIVEGFSLRISPNKDTKTINKKELI